ncbi:hypothetical protein DSO57_1006072 [Entomophthora muscae]|uniref:Uncharacterized protein n=2 Tax=Entomophthora muscae TaxID=34485 RepID=A0ACC2U648_9FUNG|nr:hypothetical protein DSO57_1038700 [Entomophthora muscae]KAJ9082288.1 hypothetical protein DSO57_1006072 [Entomophthora muscae]
MAVRHVGSDNEYQQLLSSSGKKLVVVDFFATWCGPCKAVAGPYESLAQTYSKGAVFLKVDVDQLQETAKEARVTAMPTFHVYRERSLLGSVSGADISQVKSIIDKYYKEVSSFEGSGAKLGGSTSNAPTNPFYELFKPYAPVDDKAPLEEGPAKECEIQFRLWDASMKKGSFMSNSTIQELSDFVAQLPGAPSRFYLTTQFPRRVYQGDMMSRTLFQEKLTNHGQLIVSLNP